MGRKLGRGCCAPPLGDVAWAEAYLRTKCLRIKRIDRPAEKSESCDDDEPGRYPISIDTR